MKFISFLMVLLMVAPFLVCQALDTGFPPKPETCVYLTESDAERIVGQAVLLIESSSGIERGIRLTECTYRGVSKDTVSGKGINLYLSLEQQEKDPKVGQAEQEFESAYQAVNEPDILVQRFSDIGDDAFVLSNPPNFHFIMVRKGAVIFRMKLNKAPEKTSLGELKAFAKNLAQKF